MTYQKTIGILGVLLIIGMFAIADPEQRTIQETANVDRNEECRVETWQEDLHIWNDCSLNRTIRDCSDPPLNESCTEHQEFLEQSCYVRTEKINKSREICKVTDYVVNDIVKISADRYTCSVSEDGKIYITCDSKYDGNGNGICTPGESCIQFGIVGSSVQQKFRNSQEEFVDYDASFFTQTGTVKVLS